MVDHSPSGYHYNREERLAQRPDRPEPQTGGIFRRNRSLTIILLDVSLVLLMFLLYLFLFRPQPARAEFDGYEVTGSAFLFDEGLYLTVTTTRTNEDSVPPTGAESLLTLVWPDESTATDVLPVNVSFPTVTRIVLPWTGPDTEADRVSVTIAIGEATESIELRIDR